jgi:hypothetical protein
MESPAGLNYAWNLAAKRVEAETNTTELELAIIAAATTANLATAIVSHCELRSAIEFCELTSTRHLLGSLLKNELYGYGVEFCSRCPERHPEVLEECATFIVGARGGHERDVHALGHVDAIVVDLREDNLLLETEGVVALAVESLA